jgi:hypothetical protein
MDPLSLFVEMRRVLKSSHNEETSDITVNACKMFTKFNRCIGGDVVKCFDVKKLADLANKVVHNLPLPAVEDVKITPEKIEDYSKYLVGMCEKVEKMPHGSHSKNPRNLHSEELKPSASFLRRIVQLLETSTGCNDEAAKLAYKFARSTLSSLKPDTRAEHSELVEAIRRTLREHEERCEKHDDSDMDTDNMKEMCDYCEHTCDTKSNMYSKKLCGLCSETCSTEDSYSHNSEWNKQPKSSMRRSNVDRDSEDEYSTPSSSNMNFKSMMRQVLRTRKSDDDELERDEPTSNSFMRRLFAGKNRRVNSRRPRHNDEEDVFESLRRRFAGRRVNSEEEFEPKTHHRMTSSKRRQHRNDEHDFESNDYLKNLMGSNKRRHGHDEETEQDFEPKNLFNKNRRHDDEEHEFEPKNWMGSSKRRHAAHHDNEEHDFEPKNWMGSSKRRPAHHDDDEEESNFDFKGLMGSQRRPSHNDEEEHDFEPKNWMGSNPSNRFGRHSSSPFTHDEAEF